MSKLFNRYKDIKPPVHGGTTLPNDIIDFSISINPCPLPETAAKAYAGAWKETGKYPDTECTELKSSIARNLGMSEERLLVTNGSAEAFSLIASVFLSPGKTAMVLPPCYSDYEHFSRISGAGMSEFRLLPGNQFRPDPDSLISGIGKNKPDLIWLCSPNNPTGVLFEETLIEAVAAEAGRYGGWVVLDEAYRAFANCSAVQPPERRAYNIISVRSLTKDFGVPGLRIGVVNATAEVIHVLNLHKPCWSVNTPAQKTGMALLDEAEYFRKSWSETGQLHDELVAAMQTAGINPLEASQNNCNAFVFFKKPCLVDSKDFIAGMLEHGIKVRDCYSMKAPGYCRAGVKERDKNLRFAVALQSVISGGLK